MVFVARLMVWKRIHSLSAPAGAGHADDQIDRWQLHPAGALSA